MTHEGEKSIWTCPTCKQPVPYGRSACPPCNAVSLAVFEAKLDAVMATKKAKREREQGV
jgi:hypothetical protein